MSRLSLPTRDEVLKLADLRSDICVSIYLATSPLKQQADACRIELGGLVKEAVAAAAEMNPDKKRLEALQERLDEAAGYDEFCLFQAESLALLATPDKVWIYRLANNLPTQLEVSDRFHIKPLLRSLAFSHHAYILALSDNEAKLIELFPNGTFQALRPDDMPKNALKALGYASLRNSIRELGNSTAATERKKRLADYARLVDEALRPFAHDCSTPVILAATDPVASIFRNAATICLTEEGITTSPDKIPEHELVDMARPILDKHYAGEIEALKELFEVRAGQRRVVTELADAAKAATYGMISLALVDFEKSVSGTVDEQGKINLSEQAQAYGVIDEMVKRALDGGARIVAVRESDMIGDSGFAAILRYPMPDFDAVRA